MKDMIRRFQEIDPSTHALKRELNDFIAKGPWDESSYLNPNQNEN